MENEQQQLHDFLTNLDWDKAKEITCEKCGCPVFKPAYGMRLVSELDSPNGQELVVPIKIFACDQCDHVDDKLQMMGGLGK
tara:strand:- start:180 stop:422 length:243 start_codon:yes stop_codon:yes gene_type:complete